MRAVSVPVLAAAVLLVTGPAWAFKVPEANAAWPTPHQQELAYADNARQPYAMTYSDEAARRLGLAGGGWEAFSAHTDNSTNATLKGGFDSHGAVLRLQW